MNVEMFEKVIKYLEDEPRRFDMKEGIRSFAMPGKDEDDYGSDDILKEDERPKDEMPPCGTVCCIAGATAIVSGKLQPVRVEKGVQYYDVGWGEVAGVAIEALGITGEQARRLFFIGGMHFSDSGWSKEDSEAYMNAKNSEERTKVGIARIRRFLATDGAE